MINRYLTQPTGGQFREYAGINTFFEPKDTALYQKLIPKPFSMPEKPLVFAFAVDYMKVVRWPLSRYQEWSVLVKSSWEGSEGWYCISMPVTKRVPMMGGRNLGFPKYIVDSITFTRQGNGWLAQSVFKGKPQLSFEFKPGLTRSLMPWEEEIMADESFFKQNDAFLLVPPAQGPHAQRIRIENVVPAQWSPEPGMVHIEVDQSELWAGLVPPGILFPGCYNHFKGGANLIVVGK